EPLDAELEDLELQGFLGLEVREEAALGELQLLGEPADREPLEAHAARHAGGVLEDGLAGQRAFPQGGDDGNHGQKIARSFVSSQGTGRVRVPRAGGATLKPWHEVWPRRAA